MQKHLVVSISGHGFGHIAQTAPILNALHSPELKITVRTSASAAQLNSRIHVPFTHLQSRGDIGMMMVSPLEIDVPKSRAAYRDFHAHWDTRVDDEARLLQELKADMVFSDVGYLPLAGAQRTGITNIALCSLNWSDIYRHYCGHPSTGSGPVDEIINRQIQSSYAGADAFLRTTPGMAMNDLANLIPVAPIAAAGRNRRDELNLHLKLSNEEKLVLVSMGGIHSRLPIENWPRIEGVRYLVQANWHAVHPDAIAFDALPMDFGDLLASCDALLCKPGYGSFVEAACCGVPVIYVGRPDWPESPALIEWLKHHGTCREVSNETLECGDIAETLQALWTEKKPEPVRPAGIIEVSDYLAGRLYG